MAQRQGEVFMKQLIPDLSLLVSLEKPVRSGGEVNSIVLGKGVPQMLREMKGNMFRDGIDFYTAPAEQLVKGMKWDLDFDEFLSQVKVGFHPGAWEFAMAFTAKLAPQMKPGDKFPFLMSPLWVDLGEDGEDESRCILCPKKTIKGETRLCARPIGKVKPHDTFVLGAFKEELHRPLKQPPYLAAI